MVKEIKIAKDVVIGGQANSFVLFAGPCVIENQKHTAMLATRIKSIAEELGIPFVFKASYDKANRSSVKSYRGPGIKRGLKILANVKKKCNVPLITDVHSKEDIYQAADVVDVIQIPAFLSRQTDLLLAAAKSKRVVNVKKGQFMAPLDMKNVVGKLEFGKCKQILLTERGFSFGYNNLVTDFRGFPLMRDLGYPVIYDATHSVQLPGGNATSSGGDVRFVKYLSRAAAAIGIDGLFLEVHDNPKKALCDGPNSVALKDLKKLLIAVKAIDSFVKEECLVSSN